VLENIKSPGFKIWRKIRELQVTKFHGALSNTGRVMKWPGVCWDTVSEECNQVHRDADSLQITSATSVQDANTADS